MNNRIRARQWLIRWMYATAAGHLAVGLLLPWIADLPLLNSYHDSIGIFFQSHEATVATRMAARAQQAWWISLFGPTVQAFALWMIALIRIGDKQHSVSTWGWLIAGLFIWAPQDIWISLRADCWLHVWVDCFAVATMLPPLAWLWRHDRHIANARLSSSRG